MFVTLPKEFLAAIGCDFVYANWQKADDAHTTVRSCTSCATKAENVDALCWILKQLTK